MLVRCLCIVCGAYSLGLFSSLPGDDLFLSLLFLIGICARPRRTRLIASFLCGFAAMWLAASVVIDDRLDPAMQGDTISIEVRIADFPRIAGNTLRFAAEPLQRPDLPSRVRLAWYEHDAVPGIGETWQLRVRLRRPHGYVNPGGFDYEGWLFRQKIGASGYVVSHEENRRLGTAAGTAQLRHEFVARATDLLPGDDATAVLLAVTVGARHLISREQWDRYARTGTSHLMAISGLHIGLAAGGVFLLAWVLFAPVCRRLNARDPALLLAVIAAGIYAAVSGFAVPAERAFLMALLSAAAAFCRRRIGAPNLVAIPCLITFVEDPIDLHAPGYKLSFAAVAVILWSLQGHLPPALLQAGPVAVKAYSSVLRLGILQLALLAGLFPITSLVFGRFAPVAPLVNLLILPLFNFVTVPFALAGMLFAGPLEFLGDKLLFAAYHSIRLALSLVAFAADLPGGAATIMKPAGCAIAIAILPALHVLLPQGWPGRKLAWIAIAAVVMYRQPLPPDDCLEYRVLDVGQGLAVVLRVGRYTLLYDTGASFRSGSSSADFVIVPFLESQGIKTLDVLVVSHADQDHAGGAHTVAGRFAIAAVYVGEFIPGLTRAQRFCNPETAWSVHGIRFRFLHPPADAAWEGNNASCVLEVDTGVHKLLLTGDIEMSVESVLHGTHAIGKVDSLIVPHHGSGTSSSPDFVAAVRPELAIVSAGYGNRWGFPKPDVVRRWQHAGARLLQTATSGAIGQRMCRSGEITRPDLQRLRARRYWSTYYPVSH